MFQRCHLTKALIDQVIYYVIFNFEKFPFLNNTDKYFLYQFEEQNSTQPTSAGGKYLIKNSLNHTHTLTIRFVNTS